MYEVLILCRPSGLTINKLERHLLLSKDRLHTHQVDDCVVDVVITSMLLLVLLIHVVGCNARARYKACSCERKYLSTRNRTCTI